ncbi:molybdate ABC transporter substrate-binding protein [bacterium LRH843]|nr:molybdate ABC transporter substrate-binding protein [bacterium LRH843]
MKKIIKLCFVLLIFFTVIGCNSDKETDTGEETTLLISAAASLSDSFEEIKEGYEIDNQVELTFNFGGSGNLAQQIKQGAPVDVFISANEEWMDTLEEEKIIDRDTRTKITGNNLVLVANESSPFAYKSFGEISTEDVNQIAIGNPESVPAGKYTEEALRHLHKWDQLQDKLVLAKDVRQVLTYVETGNAEIGFVYESDAHSSDKIKILAVADADLHEPIMYPAAVTTDSKNKEEAAKFIEFLESEAAQIIFENYGFKR